MSRDVRVICDGCTSKDCVSLDEPMSVPKKDGWMRLGPAELRFWHGKYLATDAEVDACSIECMARALQKLIYNTQGRNS